jgi:6-phosphogluconolactonase
MQVEVQQDAEQAAQRAAELMAEAVLQTLAQQEQCHLAFSGGSTAPALLEAFATHALPWDRVQIFQVDERIAPTVDAARNFTALLRVLAERVPLPMANLHPMPVEIEPPEEAAVDYQHLLLDMIGRPPVFDLVHLGLGADGHTASLVPGDPVLAVENRDVAVCGVYQGHKRLTLTYPILLRAKRVLFLVSGEDKRQAVQQLVDGDPAIPAGRLAGDNAILILDQKAAP